MHVRLLLLALALFLSGCAHAVSYEMRQKVNKDISFPAILRNPEAYRGETVILGGKIIETINHEGNTVIKVLQIPLDFYGVPMEEEKSQGRFLITMTGYVDGEVYSRGKMITLAGEIIGTEMEPVGETQYAYPVLQAKEVHLWKDGAAYYHLYPRPYRYWDWYGYPPYHPWPYGGSPFFLFP